MPGYRFLKRRQDVLALPSSHSGDTVVEYEDEPSGSRDSTSFFIDDFVAGSSGSANLRKRISQGRQLSPLFVSIYCIGGGSVASPLPEGFMTTSTVLFAELDHSHWRLYTHGCQSQYKDIGIDGG